MALFKWFSGKNATDLENRADEFAAAGAWGKAKLEYEKALDRLESRAGEHSEAGGRLEKKIRQSCRALADQHLHSGRELLQAGHRQDAAELFELALELCPDATLRPQITGLLEQARRAGGSEPAAVDETVDIEAEPPPVHEDAEEHFMVLCSMLPDELQDIYSGYGQAFREGYVALQQGEFQKAAELLQQAYRMRTDDSGYISVELAAAYFNLGRNEEARRLSEKFVQEYPEALPGYELLCEIFWEQNDFESARLLLKNCPQPLKASVAYVVLYGETMRRGSECEAAADWFNQHLQEHGWNDKIALALATVYEQSGLPDRALALYGRYMANCRGCGSRTPPEIECKYADLSLAGGNLSDEILEIYLALARKDPAHAADYFIKVSHIYAGRGDRKEAMRFEQIAEQINVDQ